MSTSTEKRIKIRLPEGTTNPSSIYYSFSETRWILKTKTLSGDLYILHLAWNKLKRAVISAYPFIKYFK